LLRKSNGLSWSFVSEAKKANKPFDDCTVIKLELGLGKLKLIGTREIYMTVVRVIDDYKVTKTNQELCLGIMCKNQEDVYACLILEGPKLISPDFKRWSKDVLENWRLNQSGTKGGRNQKVAYLSSIKRDGVEVTSRCVVDIIGIQQSRTR